MICILFWLFQIKLTAQEEVALELRASQVVKSIMDLVFFFFIELVIIGMLIVNIQCREFQLI